MNTNHPLDKFVKTVAPKIVRISSGATAYILSLELLGRLTPLGEKIYTGCGDDMNSMQRTPVR